MSAAQFLLLLLLAPFAYGLAASLIAFYSGRSLVKTNYRGLPVPPALGPALLLGFLAAAAGIAWSGGSPPGLTAFAMLLSGAAFFGLWDDLVADQVSGFKGHFKELFKGRLSAGLLKVITATLLALFFTGSLALPLPRRMAALFLILLSTNGINLLDRRPGRALKLFFLLALLIIFLAGSAAEAARLLLPLLTAALAAAPFDLNGRAMLGDSGANLLGAALGAAAVLYLSFPAQMALLLFWGGVNILSEYISISTLIEKSGWLRYLDWLGRPGES